MDIRTFLRRLIGSPTLMTWGSFALKSISLVIVLPLLLTRLETAEISLWYFFQTIIGWQVVMDVGFSATFSRVISFAMGGAGVENLSNPHNSVNGNTNVESLRRISSVMRFIYFRLSIFWLCLLVFVGSIIIYRPVSLVKDQVDAWAAWVVILICSSLIMWGNSYVSYLQGINRVALLRRWEIVFSAGGIISSLMVLLAGGGLFSLTLVNQVWQVAAVIRNRWLSATLEGGLFVKETLCFKDSEVFKAVWPSAWRSGVGVFMSYGTIQATGIIYAQLATASQAAMYFLALRLIQTVSQFSQAPFYSKLPSMARLYAEGRKEDLLRVARRGMSLAYWSFTVGFLCLGFAGGAVLTAIGSNVSFPQQSLWAILGFAFYIERYGAMHIQLYSLTNHIIWHVANGIMGVILMLCILGSFKFLGVYAFPTGIIVGYSGFYAWYSSLHSYRKFGMRVLPFETATSLPPLLCMFLYTFVMMAL